MSITNITSPQALVIVWNYDDNMVQPLGASANQDVSTKYIVTSDLRAVRTQKNKSSPAGQFEIELAPTANWLSRLTVGSWLAILMTRDLPITKEDLQFARQDQVKMLGRIESTRISVSVDPNTGARQTGFVVTGRDWASIFDTTVYIDTLYGAFLQKVSPSAAVTPFRNLFIGSEQVDGQSPIMWSTTEMMRNILHFYGIGHAQQAKFQGPLKVNTLPDQVFTMPSQVIDFFSFSIGDPELSKKISELIKVVSGPLKGYDQYNNKTRESVGLVNLFSMVGNHTYWQVLMEHSNPILNEMFAEMRWEETFGVSLASMTLYKRIRPFTIDPTTIDAQIFNNVINDPLASTAGTIVKPLISEFKNVRRTKISLEDVISIDAGTNWRDKINFVEILYDDAALKKVAETLNAQVKLNGQLYDPNAAQREGLKPMLVKTKFLPPPEQLAGLGEGGVSEWAPIGIAHWKYLLENWYFNTHTMLNGAVTVVGQNDYIGVGENIMIPAKVLMPTFNMSTNLFFKGIDDIYLLAHIESVSHNFGVGEDGARSFSSAIQFVRGIFTDAEGNAIRKYNFMAEGVLDPFSTDLSDSQKVRANAITTPTSSDPNSKGSI